MIKNILVPTDGSDHAAKAITLAADIADKYGAKLVLLNVRQHGPLPDSLRQMAEAEHLDEVPELAVGDLPKAAALTTSAGAEAETERRVYEVLARQILDGAERRAKEQGAKSLERVLAVGDPAKRILEEAANADADLIVMGSRGLSDLKGLMMGSVSHKVSSLSECTCITVK